MRVSTWCVYVIHTYTYDDLNLFIYLFITKVPSYLFMKFMMTNKRTKILLTTRRYEGTFEGISLVFLYYSRLLFIPSYIPSYVYTKVIRIEGNFAHINLYRLLLSFGIADIIIIAAP